MRQDRALHRRRGAPRAGTGPLYRARATARPTVDTIALLDGPFSGRAGARAAHSDQRPDRRPSGGFAFGRGCIETRFAALQAGSLRLGATRLPLCPIGPAILYQNRGRADDRRRQRSIVRGWPGGSASRRDDHRRQCAAGRAGERVQRERAGDAARPQRGAGPAQRANLARDVRQARRRPAISRGADAIIGRVPLLLSDAAGQMALRQAAI